MLRIRIANLTLKQWNCELSTLYESAFGASFAWHHRGRAMENDVEAKHLAAEFITQCRGQGRSIETIANHGMDFTDYRAS